MAQALRRWQQRAQHDEAGFTLIELIVAMVITLIVMTSLLGVFVSSLSTVSASKQRQAATALTNQAMEQLRALPYDSVTAENGTAIPAGDPNLNYTAAPVTVKPAALPGIEEVLVNSNVSPQAKAYPVDGVTYTVRTYVSKSPPSGAGQRVFNITVLTSWSSNVSNGERTSVERSVVYSPSGCLSTATHPFSGPCQASFSANAGQLPASVSVVNPDSASANIEGFDGNGISLTFPVLSTNMLLEQISSVTAVGVTTAGAVTRGKSTASSGGQRAAAAGNSDPSSPAGQAQSVTSDTQTFAPQKLSGLAGELRVSPNSMDRAKAGVAVNAKATQCEDGDALGSMLTTGLPGLERPCASANVQPQGDPGLLTYFLPGGLSMTLASIGSSSVPVRAAAAHMTAGNPQACTGTSGAGCAHAAASRALGDVVVGGLPVGGPSGFDGTWFVTSLVETARAEQGTSSSPPSYRRTGTLNWWNGSSYTSLALAADGEKQTIDTPSVRWGGGAVQIEVQSRITVNPAVLSVPTTGDCQAAACLASASGPAGVRSDTTYTVTIGGRPTTSFLVISDLGGLLATTSYKAAPNA